MGEFKHKILKALTEKRTLEFKGWNWHINFGFNIEKILFAKTLATLLRSKINIADSLLILEAQFTGNFKYVVSQVKKDVENGQSLSSALEKHPKYFNRIYIGLVNVGEKSGRLVDCLQRVAKQQEKDLQLARNVQTASLYPSIIFICLLGLAALLSYYILPQLVVVFNSFDMPLPWTTKVLLAVALFIRKYGPLLLVLIIAAFIFIKFLIKQEKIRPHWQGFLMNIPFMGELLKKWNLARFCRILGTLLQSGVSIHESLDTTIDSLSNEVYKNLLKKVKAKVLAGLSLGEAIESLYKVDIFPRFVFQLISVGERTGSLEENLIYLAEFYEEEVDSITKNLANVIEPVLLVIIGVIVAIIGAAIISPIYEFIATLSASL
ncbi:MAG: type II secretion system F family protein [Candidatus Parcubacteria bacterium]|nr:type II secretion system F family protein [Candidatus Parcubacteria bacterium]